MRTTPNIDEDVLTTAQFLAQQSGRPVGQVISDLARRALSGSELDSTTRSASASHAATPLERKVRRLGLTPFEASQGRIVSAPAHPNRRPVARVVAQLRPMFDAAEHHFWKDDISIADSRKFNHAGIVGHKQITDVHLLALAVRHGGRLLTDDGGVALNFASGATGPT